MSESKAIQRAIRWSLWVSVLMLLGKVGAYVLTGSAAIMSDAMESIIHIVATGLAAWSAWFASQPPSRRYPYGAGKIAYFSAGFEGALIFVAALAIFAKATEALVYGAKLKQLDLGLAMIAALGAINLVLGLYLIRTGKRERSLILEANGQHVLTDMWTSVAVLFGVALVWLTKLTWIDPIVAILAALHITHNAISLMRRSFEGLMESTDPAFTEKILGVLEAAKAEGQISEYHQLRYRSIQSHLWIELHLLLPASQRLEEAHDIASQIEAQIMAQFPDSDVFITSHLEPDSHDQAHPDGHPAEVDPLSGPLEGERP